MIVGVDFGAPQRARDQRRKIIAIAAHATGWHSYLSLIHISEPTRPY